MKVTIQRVWNDRLCRPQWRALIAGGVLVDMDLHRKTSAYEWRRDDAIRMKEAIEKETGHDRSKIRFFIEGGK